jgi:hypothetical protein
MAPVHETMPILAADGDAYPAIQLVKDAFERDGESVWDLSKEASRISTVWPYGLIKIKTLAHARIVIMSKDTELDASDFHVAVRRREHTEAPWYWEIWAAGKSKSVMRSERHFETMSEAIKEGKAALRAFLHKRFRAA